jgi:hypothetical protein
MARQLLNRDGSPMRKYHSKSIEELLMEDTKRELCLFANWILKHYSVDYSSGTIGYVDPMNKSVFTETVVDNYLKDNL